MKASSFLPMSSNYTKLENYIQSLSDFEMLASEQAQYNHMGATITDAILQSGLKYETVVRPRVEHVLLTYPEAIKTNDFLQVLKTHSPENVLKWQHPEKPSRVLGVTEFLSTEDIQTEADLSAWLSSAKNSKRLRRLRGIGPKTVDYFRLLCGISTTAVDRHIIRFLNDAGITPKHYDDAQSIIDATAQLMGISTSILDSSIWTYMATRD
jgi:hypothetical protein